MSDVLARLDNVLPPCDPAWEIPKGEAQWPEAAVLVGLTGDAAPRVLLGRRAQHLPLHPGEVAFPGGKRESEDGSPWDTARREAHEEVGLAVAAPTELGALPPLITRTGFAVYPCIAMLPAAFKPQMDPGEFDSLFFSDLAQYADHQLFRLESMSDGTRTRKVPHYQVGADNIWGVTAAILAQLVNVAYDAGLDLQRDWEQQP